MKIAAFNYGGIEQASSRLRSFYVFQSPFSNSQAYVSVAKKHNSEFLVFDKDAPPFHLVDKIDRKDNKKI